MTGPRIDISGRGVAELRHMRIAAHIGSSLATIDLTQHFANTGSESIEVIYNFPVPASASLLEVSASVGQRELVGRVKPNLQAEEDYEQAIEKGNSAILLQQTSPGLYSLNLGHLGKGETAVVRYRYGLLPPWQGGELRLALPTAVAPRYGDPTPLMEPQQVPQIDPLIEHRYSLQVTLDPELAAAQCESPTHRIIRDAQTLALAEETSFADRDFVLRISLATPLVDEWLPLAAEGYGLHCLAVTAPSAQATAAPRRVHFLIDCSGSMAGDSIRLAREALLAALDKLEPADRFAVSAFGTSCVHGLKAPAAATGTALRDARRWISQLDADLGGTELAGAVDAALSLSGRKEPFDLVILTDGEIWDAEPITAVARDCGARLFTIGIGAAPAAEQIDRMARETGASSEFLSPHEEFAGALERMIGRLRWVHKLDLSVDWPQATDWVSPDAGTQVWPEDRVYLFAHGVTSNAPSLRFHVEGDAGQARSIDTRTHHQAADLARIGWSQRIADLAAKGLSQEELARLSAAHGVVNAYTSLVMTDPSETVVGDDAPVQHSVPGMLAAGWGGTGQVLEAAQCLTVGHMIQRDDFDLAPEVLLSEERGRSLTRTKRRMPPSPNDNNWVPDAFRPLAAALSDQLSQDKSVDLCITALISALPDLLNDDAVQDLTDLEAAGWDTRVLIEALIGRLYRDKGTRKAFPLAARLRLRRHFSGYHEPPTLTAALNQQMQDRIYA